MEGHVCRVHSSALDLIVFDTQYGNVSRMSQTVSFLHFEGSIKNIENARESVAFWRSLIV